MRRSYLNSFIAFKLCLTKMGFSVSFVHGPTSIPTTNIQVAMFMLPFRLFIIDKWRPLPSAILFVVIPPLFPGFSPQPYSMPSTNIQVTMFMLLFRLFIIDK